jgi:hypothetical protein
MMRNITVIEVNERKAEAAANLKNKTGRFRFGIGLPDTENDALSNRLFHRGSRHT